MSASRLSLALALAAVLALGGPGVAQSTVTIGASKDNSLFQNSILSNGAGFRFFCGRTAQQTASVRTRRGLIAFDVASAVPSCATITSVQLTMLVSLCIDPTNRNHTLHRVLADWGEGSSVGAMGEGIGALPTAGDATWTHRFFPNQLWSTPGGDFAVAVSGATVVGQYGFFTWGSTGGMVADVQSWLDDPSTNFGWMLRTLEEGSTTARAIASKDAFFGQPQLQISYTAAAVSPVGVGCNGSGASAYTATANGLPISPNPNFSIGLSGGPPLLVEAVLLAPGLLPFPFPFGGPGCNLLLDGSSFILLLPASLGVAALPIPRLGIGAECATVPVQGIGIDANTQFFVLSNALDLTFGF